MSARLTARERVLLESLQQDFPVAERPFQILAGRFGLEEKALVRRLQQWQRDGLVRYLGFVLDLRRLGIVSTLVAMRVPEGRLRETAGVINSYPQVTHNYLRHGEYNLWFTLSASSDRRLAELLKDLRRRTGVTDLLDLRTEKMYKRRAMFQLSAPGDGRGQSGTDAASPGQAAGRSGDGFPAFRRSASDGARRPGTAAQGRGGARRAREKAAHPRQVFEVMTARSSGHKWPRSRYPLVIALSRPLPVSVSPFRPLARRLGLTPEALLKEVRIFQEAGVIRRAGFVVDHNAVGIKANALAAWNVRPGDLDRAGRCFASFPEVSHCYARRAYPHWPYNLYTMLHSRSGRARGDLVRAMASCPGITEYRVLTTLKEYKKTKADLASLFA